MLAVVLSYVKAINNEGFKTGPTMRINKALKAFLDPGLKGKASSLIVISDPRLLLELAG
jgi:hypothetical protein